MIKALLFDYGGTLDTCGRHWFEVLYEAWQTIGIHTDETLAYKVYACVEKQLAKEGTVKPNDNFQQLLEKKLYLELSLLKEFDEDFPSNINVARKAKELSRNIDSKVRNNITIVRPILEELKNSYRLILVSNFYGNLKAVLSNYDLLHHFDGIIESAIVGVRKPQTAIWQLGLNEAHCKAQEAIVIGDSLKNDILPAKAIGCKTIWLTPKADNIYEQPLNSSTNLIAHSYSELLEQLLPPKTS